MSFLTSAVIASALLFASTRALSAQTAARVDTQSVVVTSGSGEVRLAPDRAVLRITVNTHASTASRASADNGAALRHVVDSLKATLPPGDSVQVAGVAVRPNEDRQSGLVNGYDAQAVVRVTVRSLDRLGQILDQALGAGATGVEGISFASDRDSLAQRDALARAYAAAHANAEALATAAGLRLGVLVRISTERDFGFGGPFGGANLEEITVTGYTGYWTVPIAPRDVVARATVQATWRLVPR